MILLKTLAAAGLLVQAGAGCLAPTVLVDNGEVVTLKFGAWETVWELQGRADALCAAHDGDKEAVLHSDLPDDFDPNFRHATFDCVGPEAPAT